MFNTASPYMLYMIPAIWVGNLALVYLYKLLLLKQGWNYFVSGVVATVVKVGVIFAGFNAMNFFGVFPGKLVQNLSVAMGWTQLITATIAMFIAFSLYVVNKRSRVGA